MSHLLLGDTSPADPNQGTDEGKRSTPLDAEGGLSLIPFSPPLPFCTTSPGNPSSHAGAWTSTGHASRAQVSERVLETDEPVIGKTKALMAGVEGVLSLAQGQQHMLAADVHLTALHNFCFTPSNR